MRTTIDKAGRVLIPAQVREQLGLVPGPVDIFVDGAGIRIEVPTPDNVVSEDGCLMIARNGPLITAEEIRKLRLAGTMTQARGLREVDS
ncbi:MAG: AbrB/MazE/SpoVT family DNA-binding domain-containing protein [Microbacterium sp.]